MVFVQVMLFDASGAVIANSDEITIPPGEFRSVDFSFDDLSLAADLAGRVQTRAQVRYKSFFLVDRTRAIGFPTSIELIDAGTGHTTLFVSQEPPQVYVLDTRASQTVVELPVIVYACRPLVGLTDGKTLRVNAFYRERQSGGAVRARVSLYGANGALLAQSAQATIESGGFHSFDFDRAGIPASGEPVGRRLQMRVGLDVATTDPSSFTRDPEATGPVATSLELIDNSTGRTTAVWVTVGFFEVLPPRNPQ